MKYGCTDEGIFTVKKFSEPLNNQTYFYEPCTNISFGGGAPLGIPDPYEFKTVKLGLSTIPKSGNGVIAVRDIPKVSMKV